MDSTIYRLRWIAVLMYFLYLCFFNNFKNVQLREFRMITNPAGTMNFSRIISSLCINPGYYYIIYLHLKSQLSSVVFAGKSIHTPIQTFSFIIFVDRLVNFQIWKGLPIDSELSVKFFLWYRGSGFKTREWTFEFSDFELSISNLFNDCTL